MEKFVTVDRLGALTSGANARPSSSPQETLLQGDVVIETSAYSAWGGAVKAQIYLPLERSHVWNQVTQYSRWVEYFPDITHSQVLSHSVNSGRGCKRLYQAARKAFFLFSAQVDIYLQVVETILSDTHSQIQFSLEKGSFTDFSANLKLQDYKAGTLLTYAVQATPAILVPTILIQEAMRIDLPTNLRQMRQVICRV